MAGPFRTSSLTKVPDHLTSEQIERFRAHRATAAELFAWADHLAACSACAGLPLDPSRVAAIAEAETHLDYETLAELLPLSRWRERVAEGRVRASALLHLDLCPSCREELADLRRFAHRERRTRQLRTWRWPAAIASAAAIVLVVAIGRTPREQPVPTLKIPKLAVELRDSSRELRGRAHDPDSLVPLSPIGRILIEDRPRFEWTPIGRSKYVVEVFDDQYRAVAVSPRLGATSWTPPRPLPAGRVLTWQVTADDGTTTFTAPRPPAGEARFSVLDRSRAGALHALEAGGRPSMPLAIRYAEDGALAEAQRELSALIAADRDAETARRLLAQVQRVSP